MKLKAAELVHTYIWPSNSFLRVLTILVKEVNVEVQCMACDDCTTHLNSLWLQPLQVEPSILPLGVQVNLGSC